LYGIGYSLRIGFVECVGVKNHEKWIAHKASKITKGFSVFLEFAVRQFKENEK